MNELDNYQANVHELVQEALNHLELIRQNKGNYGELDLLIPNLERRLKRISHLQTDETIEGVKMKLPIYYGLQEGEVQITT